MDVALLLWGISTSLCAALVLVQRQSAIHEIEAGFAFLIPTAIGSAAVINRMPTTAKPPESLCTPEPAAAGENIRGIRG